MSNKLAKRPKECFYEVLSDPYIKDTIDEHKQIMESNDVDEIKKAYDMLFQDMIDQQIEIYCLENDLSDDFFDEMIQISYEWANPNAMKEKIEMYGDCLGCGKDCNTCDKSIDVDGEKYPPGVAKRIIEMMNEIEENEKKIKEMEKNK